MVRDCLSSWGHVGNNIWACGEGNADEIIVEQIYLTEGPFPRRPEIETYPCGTDVSGELGFSADYSFASGAGCEALGIPPDRITEEEWDEGPCSSDGDDDDSAGDDDDSAL